MNKLEMFYSLRDEISKGGGDEKIQMQYNLGKLTARERITSLLDEGSFIEIGMYISKDSGAVVTGYGTINGRLVYVCSDDYTVDGSNFTTIKSKKISKILDCAAKMGAPFIQIIDSSGGSLNEGLELLQGYGRVLNKLGKLSGVVPRISIVCGPCNGINSLMATMSELVISVEEISELSFFGANKITSFEEKYVHNSMIGDSLASNIIGNAHINAKNEKEAICIAKKFIQYVPHNSLENCILTHCKEDINEIKENIDEFINKTPYSMEDVLSIIVDKDSIIEIYSGFCKNVKVCLAKVNGLTVGIISNEDKKYIDNKAALKIASFVRMCDSLNISIITLVDINGINPSLKEETNGICNNLSKVMYSMIEASVPKISLIVGKVTGVSYMLLASNEATVDITLAWPTAEISLIKPEDYIKNIYRDEIFNSDDFRKEESQIIEKYYDEVVNPYKAAEIGLIDDIIPPSETKQRIFSLLDMLQTKKELTYRKKHGSKLI